MQFTIQLQRIGGSRLLTFNYQYPLSAAIYRILQRADAEYASFLHNKGYGQGFHRFKFFTFSDLSIPFRKEGSRMFMLNDSASFRIAFYLSNAAENFIRGLFMDQQLIIADQEGKTIFQVTQVYKEPPFDFSNNETVLLQPLSPIVAGRKNDRGNYDFLSPSDADFPTCLVHNWAEKFAAVQEDVVNIQELKARLGIEVIFSSGAPKQRLINIKNGTSAATSIKGFTRFNLKVRAPKEMLDMVLGAGLGLYNAQGMGCVEVLKKPQNGTIG